MFYSHTILARKGPLGTVWCAAHVQHRLKKSHYNATNIPTTVERIMYPEVPIALRMSGHLLLGVVRIYSKKIDYLFHDYNVLLIGITKAYEASTDAVNLPKDASHARSDDITLPSPNKFALDEFDLDEYSHERFHDNHRKSLEDITLADQIPFGRDPYIAISVHEDVPRDSTHSGDASGSAPVPMDEDSPSTPVDGSIPEIERMRDAVHSECMVGAMLFSDRENDVLEPDTVLEELMREKDKDTQAVGSSRGVNEDIIPEFDYPDIENDGLEPDTILEESMREKEKDTPVVDSSRGLNEAIPELERLRDAVHSDNIVDASIIHDRQNAVLEPVIDLEDLIKEKDKDTSDVEEMLISGGKSISSLEHQEQQSAPSERVPDVLGSHVSFAIQSSPPIEQPKPRRRKRHFDEKTVLTNKFMKKSLEDSRDLKRRRKDWCSSLGFWRLNNKLKQEKIFNEPLTTGLCDDLCSIFNKDYITAKHPPVSVEEAHSDPNVAHSPSPENEYGMEIEHLRNAEGPAETNNIESNVINGANRGTPSPARRDDSTLATENQLKPQSDQVERTIGTGVQRTPVNDFDMESEHPLNSEGPADSNMSTFMNSPIRGTCSPATEKQFEPQSDQDVRRYSPHSGDASGSAPVPMDEESPIPVDGSIPERERMRDAVHSECKELTFLEEDDYTPAGSRGTPESGHSSANQRGTPEVDSLSVRARAVAQYLMKKSLDTPIPGEDLHGDLSLSKILEGKRRKVCARMFFETLVLKNCGLVDVKQDEPYNDIKLKVTPKLSKGHFLS